MFLVGVSMEPRYKNNITGRDINVNVKADNVVVVAVPVQLGTWHFLEGCRSSRVLQGMPYVM